MGLPGGHFSGVNFFELLSARVEGLFGAVRHQRTGEPYSNAEVARMAVGDLTEGDVRGSERGESPTPPWAR